MQPILKLAAVDIGSHAARLQISSVLHAYGETRFKRAEYVRFPLRLGHDVFRNQHIGAENEEKLLKLLQAIQLLIHLYEVDDYMVCATAAFRDARNGQAVCDRIQAALGMPIRTIDGQEEAILIHKAIQHLLLPGNNYLHVDVGGGSTEVSFYVGTERVASQSFKLGAVRDLEGASAAPIWQQMQTWIQTQVQRLTTPPLGIATGGNIRKLAQLAKKGPKKTLPLKKLVEVRKYIASFSLDERINKLALNPDRAEVILPATQIYATVMQCGGVSETLVPDVSLRDGIIHALYQRNVRAQQGDPMPAPLS